MIGVPAFIMSSDRYGDADVNGFTDTATSQALYRVARGSSNAGAGLHSGLTFRKFTRETLHQIGKRRQHQAKRRSRLLSNVNQAAGGPEANSRANSHLKPDPALASGQQLPHAVMRQIPGELIGKPIEDIDPYYANQETFVIISKSKELTRFSANKALYLFGAFHPVRRVVLCILVNPLFSLFVIFTILTNCILMTIQGGEIVEKTE